MKPITKLDRLRAMIHAKNPPMSKKDACELLGFDPKDPELIEKIDIPDFLKDLFK